MADANGNGNGVLLWRYVATGTVTILVTMLGWFLLNLNTRVEILSTMPVQLKLIGDQVTTINIAKDERAIKLALLEKDVVDLRAELVTVEQRLFNICRKMPSC